jgi:hypothetical protein
MQKGIESKVVATRMRLIEGCLRSKLAQYIDKFIDNKFGLFLFRRMTRRCHSIGIVLISTLWQSKGWSAAGMNSHRWWWSVTAALASAAVRKKQCVCLVEVAGQSHDTCTVRADSKCVPIALAWSSSLRCP